MNWFPCELHTHTIHSDGDFTVKELCETAKKYELSCIALTDHNTVSGLTEIDDALEENTVKVIRGIEWTTYYGHMCVLAVDKYIDWRDSTPKNIHKKIDEIKKADGVIGVAHPFAVGSPMCTGCYWDFDISDWEHIDYFEVWSEEFPSIKIANQRAVRMWKKLLDNGYKIAAAYGKDWHGSYAENEPSGVTYLGIDEVNITSEKALEAIRAGRTYVTMGPTLELYIQQEDNIYFIGDQLKGGQSQVVIRIGVESRKDIWKQFNIVPKTVSLITNGNTRIAKKEITNISEDIIFDINLKKGWVVAQVNGFAMDKNCVLAVTSPFYIA